MTVTETMFGKGTRFSDDPVTVAFLWIMSICFLLGDLVLLTGLAKVVMQCA